MLLQDSARRAPGEPLAFSMLVVVMVLWSSGVIVARSVHELAHPVGFSFWRWVAACCLLTPIAGLALWQHRATLRERLGRILLLGIFMAGGSTLLVWSVQFTAATNAVLVSATQPIVTMLAAWLVLRERLSARQLLGAAAAGAGILAMVLRMDVGVLRSLSFNLGDLLVLMAVVCYAGYSVNLHRWLGGLPPTLVMYVTALSGLVVLSPFYALESWRVAPVTFEPRLLAAIVYMGLVPTVVATTMWNIAMGVVGPSRASIFLNLLPLFGTGLAVTLLDESLHAYHLVGALLICVGVSLVVTSPARART